MQRRSHSVAPLNPVSESLKKGFVAAVAELGQASARFQITASPLPATSAPMASTLDSAERELFFGLLTYLFRIVVLFLAKDKGMVPEAWPGAALLKSFR
ncbi:MAG: hypothetical protein ABIK28_16655, partial [Planctomycetota bacterium]